MQLRFKPLSFVIFVLLAKSSLPAHSAILDYNLNRPNENGVSSNTLISLNLTDRDALVLNNYSGAGEAISLFDPSYRVTKNTNFGDTSASTVIVETQSDTSQLGGMMEILGTSADLILINTQGFVCNGCGFINTNNVTLSTGNVSILPENSGFQFETRNERVRGEITVEGQGLILHESDPTVKNINLIAPTVKLNAPINANNLTVIANRGEIQLDNLADMTTLESERSAVIDISSAANINTNGKINLVVNAKGAGVNQSYLTNNGNLSSNLTQGEAISLNANDLILTNNGKLMAGNTTQQSDISVNSQRVINNASAEISAKNINLTVKRDLVNAGQITGVDAVTANVDSLDNMLEGRINSSVLTINSAKNSVNSGTLAATNNISITAGGDIENRGVLDGAQGQLNLTATRLANSLTTSRLLAKNATINIRKTIDNQGNITLTDLSSINYNIFNHQQGLIQFNNDVGRVTLEGNQFNTNSNINISGAGIVAFNRNSFTNTGTLSIANNSTAQFNEGSVNNQSEGVITNNGILSLNDLTFTNRGTINNGNTFNFSKGSFVNLAEANISGSTGNITLTDLTKLDNSGRVQANNININSVGLLVKNNNIIETLGEFNSNTHSFYNRGSLTSGSLSIRSNNGDIQNNASALLSSRGTASFTFLGQNFNNRGTVTGSRTNRLSLTGDSFQNNGRVNGGAIIETNLSQFVNTSLGNIDNQQGDIQFNVEKILVNNGKISGANITVLRNNIDLNNNGDINATGLFTANVRDFNNNNLTTANIIVSVFRKFSNYGRLLLSSNSQNSNVVARIFSNEGTIVSNNELLNHNITDGLTNSGSITGRHLWMAAKSVANSGSINTSKLDVKAQTILNKMAGIITASGSLTFSTNAAVNGRILNDGTINSTSGTALDLSATQLTNTGVINSTGRLVATAIGSIINSGNLNSESTISLTARSNINNSGKITSQAQEISLNAGDRLDHSGQITSTTQNSLTRGNVILNANMIGLGSTGAIHSSGRLLVTANGSIANSGHLNSESTIDLVAKNNIDNSGNITSQAQAISLTASNRLDHSGTIKNTTLNNLARGDVTLHGNTIGIGRAGVIHSGGKLAVAARGSLINSGNLNSMSTINLTARSNINNSGNITSQAQEISLSAGDRLDHSGQITSTIQNSLTRGNVILNANMIDLGSTGVVHSSGRLLVAANGSIANSGHLNSESTIDLVAKNNIDNSGNITSQAQAISLTASNRLDHSGTIKNTTLNNLARGDVTLHGNTIGIGRAGVIHSGGKLAVAARGSLTNSGNLNSMSTINLTARNNINNSGNITSQAQAISLNAGDRLDNSGEIKSATPNDLARGDVTLSANIISFGNKVTGKRVEFNAADNLTTLQGSILEAGYLNLIAKTQILNYATTISRTLAVSVSDGNLINRGWLYGKDSVNLAVKKGNIYNAYRIKGIKTDILAKCLFNYDINQMGNGRIYTDKLTITKS